MLKFNNSYAKLPEIFYQRVAPAGSSNPGLIFHNDELAELLAIDAAFLQTDAALQIFSGNQIPDGAEPIAMAYAGHQFGNFVPQLGDGRAILLGEIITDNGKRYDVQLKGAGQTQFSRRGDGKSAIGPVLREYIVSEAMYRLGVPTTRALFAVTTGEPVMREEIYQGAILTRIAASHIRVGTFEYFAAREEQESVKRLADYVIDRHYPQARETKQKYLDLFRRICDRQIALVAKWMAAGFIHGVMNTDNCTISGETIDYGPCAFMEGYNPSQLYSSIDSYGRYSYSNQPRIIIWNLSSLAECLLFLFDDELTRAKRYAEDILGNAVEKYSEYWLQEMRPKLGLRESINGDVDLINKFLDIMHEQNADFTLSFRFLSDMVSGDENSEFTNRFYDLFDTPNNNQLREWLAGWRDRLAKEKMDLTEISCKMNLVNPCYIARNHLVEAAIADANYSGSYDKAKKLLQILQQPYEEHHNYQEYLKPASPTERIYQTFCGT